MADNLSDQVIAAGEAYRLSQRKRAETERDLHYAQAAELQAWLDHDAIQAELMREHREEADRINAMTPEQRRQHYMDIQAAHAHDHDHVGEVFGGGVTQAPIDLKRKLS